MTACFCALCEESAYSAFKKIACIRNLKFIAPDQTMSDVNPNNLIIVEQKSALSWKIRLPLGLLFWLFFLTGVFFFFVCLLPYANFLGLSAPLFLPVNMLLLSAFCFGIAIYFNQLIIGWKKQERFPGFAYGFPAAILVWTIGGTVSILQNWYFALLHNPLPGLWMIVYTPTIAIFIAVILGFKAGKDGGRTAAFVQKTSAFLTRHKFAVLGLITLLIATSIVGQQIYYRTATRFPEMRFYNVEPVYWKYYAFFETDNCPFDKFQNLESICVTSDEDFSSIPAAPSIKELRFTGGNRSLTETDMKRLAQFPSLERLTLRFWKNLKDSDSTGLEYLPQIKGLKELSLDVTKRSVNDISYLKDIPNLETLKLYVSSNIMHDPEYQIDYTALQSAPKLKTLVLEFPFKVDEDDVERALEALPKCKIETEKQPKGDYYRP